MEKYIGSRRVVKESVAYGKRKGKIRKDPKIGLPTRTKKIQSETKVVVGENRGEYSIRFGGNGSSTVQVQMNEVIVTQRLRDDWGLELVKVVVERNNGKCDVGIYQNSGKDMNLLMDSVDLDEIQAVRLLEELGLKLEDEELYWQMALRPIDGWEHKLVESQ